MNQAIKHALAMTALLGTIGFAPGLARADVALFLNDSSGFAAATAGFNSIGTETFEETSLASGSRASVDDPLTQGIANGVFLAGLSAPLTVQANSLGGASISPSPEGSEGLSNFNVSGGATSSIVGANFFVDSLDLIFSPTSLVRAVGFNTVTIFGNDPAVRVNVYNLANTLIGTTSIAGNPAGTNFLGIVANGGDSIGRINIFSTNGRAEGADNIQILSSVTAVPEPTTIALAVSALPIGLLVWLRRRRRAA